MKEQGGRPGREFPQPKRFLVEQQSVLKMVPVHSKKADYSQLI